MEENNWLNRTELLIGKDNVQKLKNSNVVVFGLGGVGSYVVEGLVRAGIGNICIVDKDVVDIMNINRQIIADTTTIGKAKVDVEEDRIRKINPAANILKFKEFVNADNIDTIMTKASRMSNVDIAKNNDVNSKIDYVVDAIDTVSSKLDIIKYCYSNKIPLISSMGTGNKLDASKFEIADINKTSVCPLAKVIRKELRKFEIPHLKVLYSKEAPKKIEEKTTASISFVPSVAGLLIAGTVINELINY